MIPSPRFFITTLIGRWVYPSVLISGLAKIVQTETKKKKLKSRLPILAFILAPPVLVLRTIGNGNSKFRRIDASGSTGVKLEGFAWWSDPIDCQPQMICAWGGSENSKIHYKIGESKCEGPWNIRKDGNDGTYGNWIWAPTKSGTEILYWYGGSLSPISSRGGGDISVFSRGKVANELTV